MKPIKKINKLDIKTKNRIKNVFGIKKFDELSTKIMKRLKDAMMNLTDSRQKEKKIYKIWDVVVCVIIAQLSGMKSWDDIHDFIEYNYDFFRKFLKMSGGIPSAKTYQRIIEIIDHKELEKITIEFYKSISTNLYDNTEILSLDGRVNNGSKREATYKVDKVSPLNVMNVYSHKYGICIGSEAIDSKTNEIPMTKELIERLFVKGAIITWDALNTQKENVSCVIENGADYVVPIKGNHQSFYNDLKDYFDIKTMECIIAGKSRTAYKKENEYKNGCSITYEYFQTEDVNWYYEKDAWKSLNSIGLVRKTIVKLIDGKEETSVEHRYYISSLFLDIELFSKSIRSHWDVENKLHWHLDVTFKMDQNHTLSKNALLNLEIINKFCLGLLNRVKPYYNMSLRRIMNCLSFDIEENFADFIAFLSIS